MTLLHYRVIGGRVAHLLTEAPTRQQSVRALCGLYMRDGIRWAQPLEAGDKPVCKECGRRGQPILRGTHPGQETSR